MPAPAPRREIAAFVGYVCVAVAFSWPLPLQLDRALLGPIGGDTGVYVWNLWVFRHEIVEHGRLPFFTFEILALTSPVPLVLHNYTTFANLLAFLLLPLVGVVASFNLLSMASVVLSAFAMYMFAKTRSGDAAGGWLAGLLFGFSPFMSARMAEHFSLLMAAPLPIFAWLLLRIAAQPSLLRACAAGAVVAWAFLCDPYYAVYCLITVAFMAAHSVLTFDAKPVAVRHIWWRSLLDLAIVCVAGLVVGILLRGGGRVELWGLRVSVNSLYTPVLGLTVLVTWRVWLAMRKRARWSLAQLRPYLPLAAAAGAVCAVLLGPVLYALGSPFGESQWITPPAPWRSSAPGVDLLAYVVPNPYNPFIGGPGTGLLRTLPNGFVENVASVPLVAVLTILIIVALGYRPPWGMVAFTAFWALMALGPFIRIAGQTTYVPTPWALIRYLPVVGAARMPTRMTVMVMFGLAALLALAMAHLRSRSSRGTAVACAVGALLLLELLPAPRLLHSAEVPLAYRAIAADPRPLRVMTLPFGLRDGLSSRGDFSAAYQFFQTSHEKPLVGGYLSRLPREGVDRYGSNPVMRVLMRLSERGEVDPQTMDAALAESAAVVELLSIGWIVVDTHRATPELRDFAVHAFGLTPVLTDGGYELYNTPLAAKTGRQE
ncbi:MAG TPA: hypothetical protein VD833_02705 [Vicinamibacterales bacterium]|nr:hypothetical protein [Vicinamibacterales bacterium]